MQLAVTHLQLNLKLGKEDLDYVVQHSEVSWICVDESLLPIIESMDTVDRIKGWTVVFYKPISRGAAVSPRSSDWLCRATVS